MCNFIKWLNNYSWIVTKRYAQEKNQFLRLHPTEMLNGRRLPKQSRLSLADTRTILTTGPAKCHSIPSPLLPYPTHKNIWHKGEYSKQSLHIPSCLDLGGTTGGQWAIRATGYYKVVTDRNNTIRIIRNLTTLYLLKVKYLTSRTML